MFESGKPSLCSLALVWMAQMLVSFQEGLTLRGWLAPLKLTWLLPALILMLNGVFKDSLPGFWVLPALVVSYLLMGALLVHTLLLYILSQLPGQAATLTSAASVKAGGLLFRLSFLGLGIVIKNLLIFCACLLAALLSPRRAPQLSLAGA